MASIFESDKLSESVKPFDSFSRRLNVLYPTLAWDLEMTGMKVSAIKYLSTMVYFTLMIFTVTLAAVGIPTLIMGRILELWFMVVGLPLGLSIIMIAWFLMLPKMQISSRGRKIDDSLEYMLRDMEVQISAGIPLFDTLVNVAIGDYGECSSTARSIVNDVQSGKSMIEALDAHAMMSPSKYMRRTLWQLLNALRTGADVSLALKAIADDIALDKQAKIKQYAQQLNLFGLIYMMVAVIMPSMGITLLVILSSFLGGASINDILFYLILVFLSIFEIMFILFVRSKRPKV